eukprot:TRINITY_DN8278_c0_g2_i2.p1 TRINITY_DN8278_c0_g2~~TRINITY_DN8278_c0_g2_i2.p1  ORF type:complete len:111 (-),score=1.02 TRINITY_DN8278_c0_g2_i2:502-834(-)
MLYFPPHLLIELFISSIFASIWSRLEFELGIHSDATSSIQIRRPQPVSPCNKMNRNINMGTLELILSFAVNLGMTCLHIIKLICKFILPLNIYKIYILARNKIFSITYLK